MGGKYTDIKLIKFEVLFRPLRGVTTSAIDVNTPDLYVL